MNFYDVVESMTEPERAKMKLRMTRLEKPEHLGKFIRVLDPDGFELRMRNSGTAECPYCGAEVTLIDETDAWVEEAGRKRHDGYGPAFGQCLCEESLKKGAAIVDYWEGTFVLTR